MSSASHRNRCTCSRIAGLDITSNSYGNSGADNDGFDAASQEADLWNTAFGVRTLMIDSSGNGGL